MKQKILVNLTLTAVALVVGIGIGWSIKSDSVVEVPPTSLPMVTAAPVKALVKPVVEKPESPLLATPQSQDDTTLITNLVATNNVLKQMAGAHKLVESASKERVLGLVNILQTIGDDSNSMAISWVFYLAYLNHDPAGAMTLFNNSMPEPTKGQKGVMYAMYHEWAWLDLTAVLDFVVASAPQKDQEWIIHYLLSDEHFAANERLLAVANGFSDKTRAMVVRLGSKNLSAAEQFESMLVANVDDKIRRDEMSRIVRLWVVQDPQGALQRLSQLDSKLGKKLTRNLLFYWAATDAETALVAALDLNLPKDLTRSVLSGAGSVDGEMALALFNQYQDRLDVSIKESLLHSWANRDPAAAAAWLEQHPGEKFGRRGGVGTVAWIYARKDPQAALDWAIRTNVLDKTTQVVKLYAEHDLDKALLRFEELPPGSSRKQMFYGLARHMAKQDIGRAQQWLAEHKDEPGYQRASKEVFSGWARDDPKAAAQSVLANDSDREKMVNIPMVVYSWYRSDPEAAINWVTGLEKGKTRDGALMALVNSMRRDDAQRERALSLAGEISDANMRKQMIILLQS